jgi:hydroxyethylthiazole kinase-like uncharacterized protein yjeF
LAAPEPVAIPLAVAVPECAVCGYDEHDCWREPRLAELVGAADAVLVGPGIDNPRTATDLVIGLPDHLKLSSAVSLDAFALGVLSDATSGAAVGTKRLVMSPNHDEALRLLDADKLDQDETVVAAAIAQRWQAVVTYQSTVADAEGTIWRIGAGHAGLGTSGSGDVLAGAIAGLLARGTDTSQAAVWATYLHAAAGDRLATSMGRLGFLARELVDQLPMIMTEIQA